MYFAGTHDPNYQTLAGVGGDCFGADKKGGGGGGGVGGGGVKPLTPADKAKIAGKIIVFTCSPTPTHFKVCHYPIIL